MEIDKKFGKPAITTEFLKSISPINLFGPMNKL